MKIPIGVIFQLKLRIELHSFTLGVKISTIMISFVTVHQKSEIVNKSDAWLFHTKVAKSQVFYTNGVNEKVITLLG